MYPILFSFGNLSISSFGFFLTLAFLLAIFVLWKLSRAYDIDEGKVLDLAIATFVGGLVGARLYFVIFNWEAFGDISKVILLNRYPGLSFWGGLAGGLLILRFLTHRFKLNFWQVVDFASVGFLLGLALGDFGCFLGGCAYGVLSSFPIAVPVVGLIGKRLPVSAIEGLILMVFFLYLWGQIIKFHFTGKIASVFLMILGVVKFVTEFYRGDSRPIAGFTWITYGHVWSAILLIGGITIFYRQSKRKIGGDVKSLLSLFLYSKKRKLVLSQLKKSCYNFKIGWKFKINLLILNLRSLPKKLKRRFNVKSTPTNIS